MRWVFQLLVSTPGDLVTWRWITAATQREAEAKAEAAGLNGSIIGNDNPDDPRFLGQSQLSFFRDNPDRIFALGDIAGDTAGDGGGEFAIGGPTDPIIGAEGPGGFGAAFRNILQQQGLGGLRGVGRSLQDPLQTLFQTGFQGAPGTTGGLFAVEPGRGQFQRSDFISRALAGIRGGASSIGDIASQIFGAEGTAEQEKFFIPQFGTRGEVEDAISGANLARLAARKQFGTAFASALPSGFDLVEEFRAQPQGTGTLDFRDFLARRTQRGFTR